MEHKPPQAQNGVNGIGELPAWKRFLIWFIDSPETGKYAGVGLMLLNAAGLALAFRVTSYEGARASLMGLLFVTALMLSFGELAVLRLALGAEPGFLEFHSGRGRLLIACWAAVIAVSLGIAIYERGGASEARYREQQEERAAEYRANRELYNNPNVRAGSEAVQRYRERAATNPAAKPFEGRSTTRPAEASD